MEIVNIPIVDFYRYCLDCAYERGFKWVLCLLAREADTEMSYRQIQKYWNSLHDLTGNQILFVFAGVLNEDDDYSSVLYHEHESWRGLRNTTLHILDNNPPTIPYYKYPKIDFNKISFDKITVNHTRSISELRNYFCLSEKEIPSLVFTPTYQLIRNEHVVVHLKGDNLYQEIKEIFENIETVLEKLKIELDEYEYIKIQLAEISKQIEMLNYGTNVQKRYANAKKCLNEIIYNTKDDNLKKSLIRAMNSHSRTVWNSHVFDHKTRAYLNQYHDLLENNPDIDRKCEKRILELTRLHKEEDRMNFIAENSHEKIISLYQHLKKIIEDLPDKVDFDEEKFNRGEKRFKIAFSFPGEYRDMISKIANGVADIFSEESILYDMFHRAEFARPNLDIYLQNLYKNESELIVVFICEDYNRKEWCGIEWRAIRELMNSKKSDDRILLVKCGEGEVDGIFNLIDGYIDSTKVHANDIIKDIVSRYYSIVNA